MVPRVPGTVGGGQDCILLCHQFLSATLGCPVSRVPDKAHLPTWHLAVTLASLTRDVRPRSLVLEGKLHSGAPVCYNPRCPDQCPIQLVPGDLSPERQSATILLTLHLAKETHADLMHSQQLAKQPLGPLGTLGLLFGVVRGRTLLSLVLVPHLICMWLKCS